MRAAPFVCAATLLAAGSAFANGMTTYECQRFKSQCVGEDCDRIYSALAKDVGRSLLQVRRTERVLYEITPGGAKETIQGMQLAESKGDGNPLIQHYMHVANAYGVITLTNKDSKGQIKEQVDIQRAMGIYRYYLIHRDGSIKDIPVGEPYSAYFGWCDNTSPKDASLPDATPAAAPETPAAEAPAESAPEAAPADEAQPATPPATTAP